MIDAFIKFMNTPLTFEQVYIGEGLFLLALVLLGLLAMSYFWLWPEQRRRAKRKAQKQELWAKMNDGCRHEP